MQVDLDHPQRFSNKLQKIHKYKKYKNTKEQDKKIPNTKTQKNAKQIAPALSN